MKLLALALFFSTLVSCAFTAPVARGLTGSDDGIEDNSRFLVARGLTGSDDDLESSFLISEYNSADGLALGNSCLFNSQCSSNVCNGGNCDICIVNEHCGLGMICNDDGACVDDTTSARNDNDVVNDATTTAAIQGRVSNPTVANMNVEEDDTDQQEFVKDKTNRVIEHHEAWFIVCGAIGVAAVVGGVAYKKLSHRTIVGSLHDSLA